MSNSELDTLNGSWIDEASKDSNVKMPRNASKASKASKDPAAEPITVAQAIYEDMPVRLAVSGYLGTIFQLLPFPPEAVRWDLIRSATLELLNPNASPSSAFDVLAALGSSDGGEEATARSLESIAEKVTKQPWFHVFHGFTRASFCSPRMPLDLFNVRINKPT